MPSSIVLNIPHASADFPSDGIKEWGDGIEAHVARWTDWHTDWLFSSEDERVKAVRFGYSRFFCDVERLEDDPLEAVGQGIIYKSFEGIRRDVDEHTERMARGCYADHMGRLRRLISDGSVLVVDCHSFPSDLSLVEICIGVNDDWSRPSAALLDAVIGHFEAAGYKTALNTPYSNSISPLCTFAYPSLMIEVNKGLYLNEDNTLSAKASALKACISELYTKLLAL